jgi:hypothetical protein
MQNIMTQRRTAALLLCVWSCGGGTSEREGTSAACQEASVKLRGCDLLSQGEVDCRLFENTDYARCSIDCLRPASCAELRAATCDDTTNDYASCLDRCTLNAFATVACGDGTRVSIDRSCDGENDCNDGADEAGCDDPEPLFSCESGESVPLEYKCDGSADCADSSDESGCPQRAETLCPGGF